MKNRIFLVLVAIIALVIVGSVLYTQANSSVASTSIAADKTVQKDSTKQCPHAKAGKAGCCDKAKEMKPGCCDKAKDAKPGCCDKAKESDKSCPGACKDKSGCEKNCPAQGDKK